jgi:hypothetical protein
MFNQVDNYVSINHKEPDRFDEQSKSMGISNLYEFDFAISHTITNYFWGEW